MYDDTCLDLGLDYWVLIFRLLEVETVMNIFNVVEANHFSVSRLGTVDICEEKSAPLSCILAAESLCRDYSRDSAKVSGVVPIAPALHPLVPSHPCLVCPLLHNEFLENCILCHVGRRQLY